MFSPLDVGLAGLRVPGAYCQSTILAYEASDAHLSVGSLLTWFQVLVPGSDAGRRCTNERTESSLNHGLTTA